VTGWTNPSHVLWLGSAVLGQVTTQTNLYATASGFSRATNNFTLFWTGRTSTGRSSGRHTALPTTQRRVGASPIGLFSNTVGSKGRHGSLFDIWWGTWTSSFQVFSNGAPYNGAARTPSRSSGRSSCLERTVPQVFDPWRTTRASTRRAVQRQPGMTAQGSALACDKLLLLTLVQSMTGFAATRGRFGVVRLLDV